MTYQLLLPTVSTNVPDLFAFIINSLALSSWSFYLPSNFICPGCIKFITRRVLPNSSFPPATSLTFTHTSLFFSAPHFPVQYLNTHLSSVQQHSDFVCSRRSSTIQRHHCTRPRFFFSLSLFHLQVFSTYCLYKSQCRLPTYCTTPFLACTHFCYLCIFS